MANKKVSDLTELTTVSDSDLLYVVDVSDTTDSAAGTSKYAQVGSVKTALNVAQYGAVGDGSTDDTAAIQAAIDAAGNNGTVVYGAGLTYLTSSTLTVPYDDHHWEMGSATINPAFDGIGIQFGETGVRHFRIVVRGGRVVRLGSDGGDADYTSGNIGVQFLNVSRSSYTDFSIEGFERGLMLAADSAQGTSYFTGMPVSIINCRSAIYIEPSGAGSFCNENAFFGAGSISYSTNSPNAAGAYAIYMSAASSANAPNNNKFFGLSFEGGSIAAGDHDGCIYNNGQQNQFYGCRYEGWSNPFISGDTAQINGVYSYGVGLTGIANVDTANHGFDFVIDANRSSYRGGGDGTNPMLRLREFSTVTNMAILVEDTSGIDSFGIRSDGRILTNQDTANTNTPSGATAYQLAIYNESGTLLGYIPVYGSAW